MASVREMLDLVKCKIRFTTDEGEYEGIVRFACPISEKMMIENMFFLPDRIFMGTLTFSRSEISNCVILNRPSTVDAEENILPSINYYENHKDSDRILLDDQDDSDVLSVDTEQDYPEEDYVLKLPPGFDSIPIDIVTLDCIGREFSQAVDHIRSETTIGVSLEGPKLGRHGTIAWLGLSTSHCTFLFDIQELGKAVFDNGLRDIMEDRKIQKIIHDCREVSDCLFHMFDTRLVNVFDTQVADKLVTMQKSKDCKLDNHVNSLNACLRTYLEVPEDFLYRFNLSQTHYVNVIMFRQRPPKQDLKDLMVKNVIYLRFLKEKMEHELLNPFRRAVEVYLQVLQCATNQELLLEPSVPDKLPPELVLQGIQIVRFKNHVDVPLDIASGTLSERLHNPVEQLLKLCESSNMFSDNLLESQLSTTSSSTEYELEKPKLNTSKEGTQHRNISVKSDSSLKYSNSRTAKDIQDSVSDYSRSKIDKMYKSAVSEIYSDEEKSSVVQMKEIVNLSEPNDPWADLRAAFSKHSSANKIEKSRFIPA